MADHTEESTSATGTAGTSRSSGRSGASRPSDHLELELSILESENELQRLAENTDESESTEDQAAADTSGSKGAAHPPHSDQAE